MLIFSLQKTRLCENAQVIILNKNGEKAIKLIQRKRTRKD